MFLLWKNPGNSVGGHQDMLNSREKKIDGGFNHSISSSCATYLLKLCADIKIQIQIQLHIETQIQDMLNFGE